MNGFKETEIGLIPEDWEVSMLSEYAENPQYGYTDSAIKRGTAQFLRITDITENGVNWNTVPFCNCPEESVSKYLLKNNDIVFARIGATTGKSYLIIEPPKAIYASYLIRVRTRGGLYPEFLIHYFQSEFYWQQINSQKGNCLKGGVNGSILKKLIVVIPSPIEQKAIAKILFTIQQAIQNQQALIDRTTELKKALMNKLFTEGTKGEKQKETEIGLVPESWEVVVLGNVVEKSKGGGTPSTKKPEYWNGNIDWTTSKWLNKERIYLFDGEKKITKLGLENSSTNLLPENNLLVSTRVVIGKATINKIPIAYSQDLTGLWIMANLYNLVFLAYQFQFERVNNYLQSLKKGATIQGITREDLLKTLFVVPEFREQKEIASILSNLDKKNENHKNKKSTLESLFKTTLHELMTGKRRVKIIEFENMETI